MFDHSKIYKELDKLKAKGFSLQRSGDTSKLVGKNISPEKAKEYSGQLAPLS